MKLEQEIEVYMFYCNKAGELEYEKAWFYEKSDYDESYYVRHSRRMYNTADIIEVMPGIYSSRQLRDHIYMLEYNPEKALKALIKYNNEVALHLMESYKNCLKRIDYLESQLKDLESKK